MLKSWGHCYQTDLKLLNDSNCQSCLGLALQHSRSSWCFWKWYLWWELWFQSLLLHFGSLCKPMYLRQQPIMAYISEPKPTTREIQVEFLALGFSLSQLQLLRPWRMKDLCLPLTSLTQPFKWLHKFFFNIRKIIHSRERQDVCSDSATASISDWHTYSTDTWWVKKVD